MRRESLRQSRMALAGAIAVLTLSWCGSSPAQTRPSTAPATSQAAQASTMPADAVALDGEITSVKGAVEIRERDEQPWKPAKVGMKINQGTAFRTGLRSAVQFVISGDQTITLDRLGTITVLEAYQTRGKAKTDLGLKYGRARYDIKKADLDHESTIRSPGSTLAIRGTDIVYEDQAPWVPRAISRTGRAEFRNYRRQFLAFGGSSRATVAADKDSTAQQAIAQTKADPRGAFAGRTGAEDQLNLQLTSIGGADAPALAALLAQRSGFGGATDSGVPDVPGPLDFLIGWDSIAAQRSPTNVDLFVTDPTGHTVSAANPTIGTGRSEGRHMGDDLGLSGGGVEDVIWTRFFPAGSYTVTARHQGGDDAQFTLAVTRGAGATTVASFGNSGDPDAPIILSTGQEFTRTIDPAPATANAAPLKAAKAAEKRRLKAERAAAQPRR